MYAGGCGLGQHHVILVTSYVKVKATVNVPGAAIMPKEPAENAECMHTCRE